MYRQTLQSGIVPYGQGDITSSEMDFSLVAYDTPDSEGPSIQAFVYFNWIKPFVLREFRDKIIVAWGGNLAFESYSAAVTYKVYSGGNWGAVSSTQQVDYYADLSNINGSGYYLFDQSDNISNRAQYGRFAFSLEQRGYENICHCLILHNRRVSSLILHQSSGRIKNKRRGFKSVITSYDVPTLIKFVYSSTGTPLFYSFPTAP